MKVRDLMTGNPKCCGPDTNLAEAIELMWTNDCGVLPVMEEGKLTGIVTDRDVCIAVGTRNCRPSDTTVKEVATGTVHTCAPDDDVDTAMAIMRRAQVRRLPVVEDGKLAGILALNDIILAAAHKYAPVDADGVMNTMRAVSEHRGQKSAAPSVTPSHWPTVPVVVA
jgi:CBS domain-containing protein